MKNSKTKTLKLIVMAMAALSLMACEENQQEATQSYLIQGKPVTGAQYNDEGGVENSGELCAAAWEKNHGRIIAGLTRVYAVTTPNNELTMTFTVTKKTADSYTEAVDVEYGDGSYRYYQSRTEVKAIDDCVSKIEGGGEKSFETSSIGDVTMPVTIIKQAVNAVGTSAGTFETQRFEMTQSFFNAENSDELESRYDIVTWIGHVGSSAEGFIVKSEIQSYYANSGKTSTSIELKKLYVLDL